MNSIREPRSARHHVGNGQDASRDCGVVPRDSRRKVTDMSLLDRAFKIYANWCDTGALYYQQPQQISEEEFRQTLTLKGPHGQALVQFKVTQGELKIHISNAFTICGYQLFGAPDKTASVTWRDLAFDIFDPEARKFYLENPQGDSTPVLPITSENSPETHRAMVFGFQCSDGLEETGWFITARHDVEKSDVDFSGLHDETHETKVAPQAAGKARRKAAKKPTTKRNTTAKKVVTKSAKKSKAKKGTFTRKLPMHRDYKVENGAPIKQTRSRKR